VQAACEQAALTFVVAADLYVQYLPGRYRKQTGTPWQALGRKSKFRS